MFKIHPLFFSKLHSKTPKISFSDLPNVQVGLSPFLVEFIKEQKIFFVGTAAGTGTINVSPKGSDSLRVIDKKKLSSSPYGKYYGRPDYPFHPL